jgi:hypothetical protein
MSLTLSECIRVNTDTAIVDKDEGFGHTPTPQDKVVFYGQVWRPLISESHDNGLHGSVQSSLWCEKPVQEIRTDPKGL